jgi:methyl-accepting chemotaxis protein
MLVLGVGVLVAVAFGLALARLVTRTVARVADVLGAVAAGDLTRTAGIRSKDEVGRMALALDEANTRLRDLTQAVTGSTDIARNITMVATGVRTSTTAIDEARTSVDELARTSTELRRLVSQFRY